MTCIRGKRRWAGAWLPLLRSEQKKKKKSQMVPRGQPMPVLGVNKTKGFTNSPYPSLPGGLVDNVSNSGSGDPGSNPTKAINLSCLDSGHPQAPPALQQAPAPSGNHGNQSYIASIYTSSTIATLLRMVAMVTSHTSPESGIRFGRHSLTLFILPTLSTLSAQKPWDPDGNARVKQRGSQELPVWVSRAGMVSVSWMVNVSS